MGIIYNSNVPERELYSAYGLTVYGKENDYDWSIYPDRPREKCYISLRILDSAGNNLINLHLGNRCIFKENIDRTIDNFLYWIFKDSPEAYIIENAVFKSLTCTDSIFNHRMEMRKRKEREQEEQRKRAEEHEYQERAAVAEIKRFCDEHGVLLYEQYEKYTVLQALHTNARNIITDAISKKDNDKLDSYVRFAEDYPANKDLRIIKRGTLEDVLQYVRK